LSTSGIEDGEHISPSRKHTGSARHADEPSPSREQLHARVRQLGHPPSVTFSPPHHMPILPPHSSNVQQSLSPASSLHPTPVSGSPNQQQALSPPSRPQTHRQSSFTRFFHRKSHSTASPTSSPRTGGSDNACLVSPTPASPTSLKSNSSSSHSSAGGLTGSGSSGATGLGLGIRRAISKQHLRRGSRDMTAAQ
jgi:hypothetical protein